MSCPWVHGEIRTITVYQALCALKVHAAEQGEIDPDQISFTTVERLARLTTAGQAAANPQALGAARLEVVQELLNDLLPHAATAAANG